MKELVSKINRLPLWAAFLVYEALITVRIFWEMGRIQPWIFVMQLFWFNCVLMFFVIFFKHLLKIGNNSLPVLASGALLTYVPLIYSTLVGHSWHLNFIPPVSPVQVACDMLTLLAFHEYDWPMFPELLLLLLGSFALGRILSGKTVHSLITACAATWTSFFCIGFAWVAVNPKHPALVHLTVPLSDFVFYALYYIVFFMILLLIAFWREILNCIKTHLYLPISKKSR